MGQLNGEVPKGVTVTGFTTVTVGVFAFPGPCPSVIGVAAPVGAPGNCAQKAFNIEVAE